MIVIQQEQSLRVRILMKKAMPLWVPQGMKHAMDSTWKTGILLWFSCFMREHLPSLSGLRLVRGRKTCVSFNLNKIWEMCLQSNSELCVIPHFWQARDLFLWMICGIALFSSSSYKLAVEMKEIAFFCKIVSFSKTMDCWQTWVLHRAYNPGSAESHLSHHCTVLN